MQWLRGRVAWGLVILVLGLVMLSTWGILQALSKPHTTVMLGRTTYRVTLARTDVDQKRGLSGVTSLGDREGMLFVFPSDGSQSMWMKDMSINLDIVWLDHNKRVTHIEHDLTPDSYPSTYQSPIPARYVLEIPAGSATENSIKIGNTATFDIN